MVALRVVHGNEQVLGAQRARRQRDGEQARGERRQER
jgi:hypothetical protein